MHILYHHRTLAKDGQDVHITEMIHAFRAAGHTVTVVAPRQRDNDAAESQPPATGLIPALKRLMPGFLYELAELAYSLRAYGKLKQACKTCQPDFIYERNNLFTLSGMWLARKTGLPLVLEVNAPLAQERLNHGNLKLFKLAKRLEDKVWRSADVVIPVTDVLADYVRQAGVAASAIEVMHNGINPDLFMGERVDCTDLKQNLGLTDKLVLGFTGFLRPWHRLDAVIELMAADQGRHNLHLLVICEGPGIVECELLAAKRGIQDQVTFAGRIERAALAPYINCFDIALQPAVTDYASPLKMFEYMALSKAIIAPNQANIREILTDNQDALLFDSENDSERQQALVRYIEDPALREKHGAAARQTLDDKGFYWSKNAERVIAKVKEIKR